MGKKVSNVRLDLGAKFSPPPFDEAADTAFIRTGRGIETASHLAIAADSHPDAQPSSPTAALSVVAPLPSSPTAIKADSPTAIPTAPPKRKTTLRLDDGALTELEHWCVTSKMAVSHALDMAIREFLEKRADKP